MAIIEEVDQFVLKLCRIAGLSQWNRRLKPEQKTHVYEVASEKMGGVFGIEPEELGRADWQWVVESRFIGAMRAIWKIADAKLEGCSNIMEIPPADVPYIGPRI